MPCIAWPKREHAGLLCRRVESKHLCRVRFLTLRKNCSGGDCSFWALEAKHLYICQRQPMDIYTRPICKMFIKAVNGNDFCHYWGYLPVPTGQITTTFNLWTTRRSSFAELWTLWGETGKKIGSDQCKYMPEWRTSEGCNKGETGRIGVTDSAYHSQVFRNLRRPQVEKNTRLLVTL